MIWCISSQEMYGNRHSCIFFLMFLKCKRPTLSWSTIKRLAKLFQNRRFIKCWAQKAFYHRAISVSKTFCLKHKISSCNYEIMIPRRNISMNLFERADEIRFVHFLQILRTASWNQRPHFWYCCVLKLELVYTYMKDQP